jgi:hypothetical protein
VFTGTLSEQHGLQWVGGMVRGHQVKSALKNGLFRMLRLAAIVRTDVSEELNISSQRASIVSYG